MKRLRYGSTTLLVIVFGGIFFTLLVALSSFVLAQNRIQEVSRERAEALSLAEAGIDYYRWFLTHNPGDPTNGTGHGGPYVTTYNDPEGSAYGKYSLSVTGNSACGVVQSIDVSSVGTPSDAPGISATVNAHYAAPSVATYSYIIGASVWAGSDRVINGPYHSNGGIRMDGTANAPVTSSNTDWDCTSDFGCSPEQYHARGVVGSGPNQNLWSDGQPQVDFTAISADFASLKSIAQTGGGIYLPRLSTSGNPHVGYHLIFNANGTVTINKVNSVTTLNNVQMIDGSSSSVGDYTLMNNQTGYQTLPIPSSCGLIFVEDNVWLEGTIPAKITVIAANAGTPSILPDVVLHGSLVYAATDGSDGLTVIAAHNVLIAPDSPQNLTLDGAFIAQSGAFGRNYYYNAGNHHCDGTYEPRNTLTIFGSTVSSLRTGTQWENGCGSGNDAGYQTRIDSYDRRNAANPPPFTPGTSVTWQVSSWQQK